MMSPGNRRCVIVLGALLLGGCAWWPFGDDKYPPPPGYIDQFAPLAHAAAPVTRIASSDDGAVRRQGAFAVAPASCTLPDVAPAASSAGPLFVLRNQLEARGYAFAPRDESSLLALIEYTPQPVDEDRGSMFRGVRPDAHVLDTALPPPLAALTAEARERCSQLRGWGAPPPLQPMQRAPVDAYHPTLRVTVFERDSGNTIWIGEAAGLSHEADPTLSSQVLLRNLVRQLPRAEAMTSNLSLAGGYLGFGFVIASNDGSRFRPVISGVDPRGPARAAGLYKGEAIIAIDNQSTLNHSTATISAMLAGAAGTIRTLTIDRDGGPVLVTVEIAERQQPW